MRNRARGYVDSLGLDRGHPTSNIAPLRARFETAHGKLRRRLESGLHIPSEATVSLEYGIAEPPKKRAEKPSATSSPDGATRPSGPSRALTPHRGAPLEGEAEFFRHLPVGMARVTPQGCFELVNDALCRMLGYTREELIAADSRKVTFPADIDVKKRFSLKSMELAANDGGDGIEERHVRKDGSILYARMSAKPVRDDDRTLKYWLLQLTDIEETWRAKRVQELHRSVLEMLTAGASMNEILLETVTRAEEFDPTLRAVVMLLDPTGERFERVTAPSMPPVFSASLTGFELKMGLACCSTAVTTNRRVVVPDIRTHPDWSDFQELAEAIGARSCVSQPISNSSSKVLGVFSLVGADVRSPSLHDLTYMTGMGQLIGLGIERHHAIEALRISRARFQTMLDNAPEVVLLVDYHTGRFIEANERVREIYRCSPEEFVRVDPWTFAPVHQIDGRTSREVLGERFAETVAGASPIFNFTVRAIDGRTRQCEIRLVRLPTKTGLMIRASVIDVSQHRKAEHALRSSEEHLRAMLHSIGDGLIATDIEGRITQFNPVAETITGVHHIDAIDRPVTEVVDLLGAEDRTPLGGALLEILQADMSPILECHALLVSKDGSERYVSKRATQIRGVQGQVTGMVLVLTDLTEWREAQERALQSRKMEAIGQLAGGVAHDFNNLLTSIMGNAEFLAEHTDEDVRAAAQMITVAASRSADVTGQLLRFSRNEPTAFDPVDLHVLIREACKIMEHSLKQSVAIEFDFEASNPVVFGDATSLQNVFLNLILNAKDAIHAHGRADGYGRIRIETVNTLAPKRAITIRVTDNGVGISSDVQKHIFEPFFTTKKVGAGTGLGLAGIYGTVKTLDGSISVDSKPGSGASFCVTLPSVGAEKAPDVPVEEPFVCSGVGRILVVDDEPLVRSFALRALASFGYEAVGAADGIEAEELFRESPFDLVLLDMVMPRRGGLETYRVLASIDPDVHVIVVSGYSRDHAADEITRAGAKCFLQKPFKLKELAATVKTALESRRNA